MHGCPTLVQQGDAQEGGPSLSPAHIVGGGCQELWAAF